MTKGLTHIPQLHDNDYNVFDVFDNLCYKNINHDFTFTDISKDWNAGKKTDLTAIDLFCGCGGISKGLEMAGINVVAGLDFFKEAGETYKNNFNHKFVYGDITKNETKEELYKTIKEELNGKQLNIVAGGFPCQGFSMSGKRDIDDPRNKLYLEALDVVKTLNPEFVFLENVKGLLSMDGGRVKQKILEDFKNIGYNMQAHILSSAEFDTPQKRERVVFIGNRIGKKILYPQSIIKNGKYKTTKDAIEDLMNKKEDTVFSHIMTKHNKEMQDISSYFSPIILDVIIKIIEGHFNINSFKFKINRQNLV
jgi:DNA (cytosine-5)-methyltransferase 1